MKNMQLIKNTYPYYWVHKNPKSRLSIFYIHGYASTPHPMFSFFDKITKANIYAVELPGHYITPLKDTKDLNPLVYAKQCIDLIKALKLDNIVLIGHSMGGGIAMMVAASLKNKIKKLVLITPMNSSCANLKSFFNFCIKFQPTNRHKVKLFYNVLVNKQTANIMSKENGDELIDNFQVRRKNYRILRSKMMSLKNMRNLKQAEQAINAPTLLMVGDHDKVIDNKKTCKSLTKHIKKLQIHNFANAGHLPFEECEQEFTTRLNFFLDLF